MITLGIPLFPIAFTIEFIEEFLDIQISTDMLGCTSNQARIKKWTCNKKVDSGLSHAAIFRVCN
jgi:hypothetical protein